MDTGMGKLTEISNEKFEEFSNRNISGLFRVGEILLIRGCKFKIHNINKFGLKLRIIK